MAEVRGSCKPLLFLSVGSYKYLYWSFSRFIVKVLVVKEQPVPPAVVA